MKYNAHKLKADLAERCRVVMYADHVRMAELHAYYLSLLPKRMKSTVLVESRINNDLRKIRPMRNAA